MINKKVTVEAFIWWLLQCCVGKWCSSPVASVAKWQQPKYLLLFPFSLCSCFTPIMMWASLHCVWVLALATIFLLRQIWISGAHPWQSKFTFKGKKKVLKSGLADVKLLQGEAGFTFANVFFKLVHFLKTFSFRLKPYWADEHNTEHVRYDVRTHFGFYDGLAKIVCRLANVLIHNGIKFVDSHRQEKRQQVCNLIYLLVSTM